MTGQPPGKLVSAWEEYRSRSLPYNAPAEQVKALRASFFAGMRVFLTRLHPATMREAEYRDWELLQEFRREGARVADEKNEAARARGQEPTCWHAIVSEDGVCRDCGKRAAVQLDIPRGRGV